MLQARELKDDSRERNRTIEEGTKHFAYGASGGNKKCMDDLKAGVQVGVVRQEAFDRAETAFKEAMQKEWSEARQEYARVSELRDLMIGVQ